jgi:hypothetical protein
VHAWSCWRGFNEEHSILVHCGPNLKLGKCCLQNNQLLTKTLVSMKDDFIKIKLALIMPIVITLKTMA